MKTKKSGKQLGLAFGATVFLGGTVDSDWRAALLPLLHAGIDAYNPVVADWNEAAQAEERRRREVSDYCVYMITPRMTGILAIAEAVDDSNKRPKKTVFCFEHFEGDAVFTPSQLASLQEVGKMVQKNGGRYFQGLINLAQFLNTLGHGA